MTDTFFTIAQVAERLQVSEKTVRRMLVSGELPGYKFGGQYRIKPAELEAWIAEQAIDSASTEGGDA
jgi:excisionase family DNA binding protein